MGELCVEKFFFGTEFLLSEVLFLRYCNVYVKSEHLQLSKADEKSTDQLHPDGHQQQYQVCCFETANQRQYSSWNSEGCKDKNGAAKQVGVS